MTVSTSIVERKNKKDISSFTAQVRVRNNGKLVFSEAKTFPRKEAAKTWLLNRSEILGTEKGIQTALRPRENDPTIDLVIQRYMDEQKKIGDTKRGCLKIMQNAAFAELRCSQIRSDDIVGFAKGLNVEPSTIGNYLSHLASVFKVARPAWGYQLDYQVIEDARIVTKHFGVTSRSKSRSRRPTLAELDTLMAYFSQREQREPRVLPMTEITYFALFSNRRQAEITRLKFAEFDETYGEIMVRDMKHPGEKIGNDVMTKLPQEALNCVLARKTSRKQRDGLVFPFDSGTISRAFTDACAMLGIKDLHFHDLRHEGISRLFEMGWAIPNVAQVSGHRSWSSLKRYTHLRQDGDKYKDWSWHERVKPATSLRLATKEGQL